MSKETWYGTEHSVRPIADTLKAAVEKIASGQDWNAELMLPKPNAFVPTNFDVEAKEIAPVPLKKPYLLQDDEVVKLWYKMDDQFLVPKMQASFLLRCPVSYASPRFATLSKLYTLMVKDALNEYSYDADIAGLEYRLDATWEGLLLNLQGYNHKLGVLLDTIVRKMSGFQADPERFELIKEKLIRNYRNFDLEQPYQHALYYTTYLTQEKLWTNQEKLHELLDVTVDELNAFVPMMLNQLHMEGLVHGNISAQGAVDLANIVSSAFQAKPITKQERLGARHIMLPENSRYVYEHPVPDPSNVNSSLEYLVQVADITDKRKRALVNLLAQIAREPCFDQLRTKEQLGYIVFSGLRTLGLNTGFRILLQSERDTCFLEQRVEAFLLQLEDIMANMTDEEFASNVSAVIFKKLEKDKNLFNEANRLWSHIHSGFYDFMQNEQDVAELQTISKQELVDFYRHYVHPGSPHLKKLSVHIGSQVQSMSEPWTHVHNCLTAHGLDISPQDVHAAMTTLSLEDAVKQLANGCTPEQLEQLHAQINAQISMEPVHPESTRKELLDKNELVVDAVAFKAKLQLTQAPYPMAEHGLHKL